MPAESSGYDDELLDDREAAADLKVSIRTYQRRRSSGTGPEYIRVGNLVRTTRKALTAYKARHTFTSRAHELSTNA